MKFKAILPTERSISIQDEFLKKGLKNIEIEYYSNNLTYEALVASEAQKIEVGKCDNLFIVCPFATETFNDLTKNCNFIVAIIETEVQARYAKLHNNAECLLFNDFALSNYAVVLCIEEFIVNKFEGGRHKKRIDMVKKGRD